MTSITNTVSAPSMALSGMRAAQKSLDASSHNVANLSTAKFHRHEATAKEAAHGGVTTVVNESSVEGEALATDMVAQMQAKTNFMANLSMFRTSDAMAGTLLSTKA